MKKCMTCLRTWKSPKDIIKDSTVVYVGEWKFDEDSGIFIAFNCGCGSTLLVDIQILDSAIIQKFKAKNRKK